LLTNLDKNAGRSASFESLAAVAVGNPVAKGLLIGSPPVEPLRHESLRVRLALNAAASY